MAPSPSAAPVDRAVSIDVPPDELVERMTGRWVCRESGHVYNEQTNRPGRPVCDLDGSELFQREDDKAETIRARLATTLSSLAEVGQHYAARACSAPSMAARGSTPSPRT